MPIVQIHLLSGRSPEKKARLLTAVTQAVVESLDVPPSSVRVILSEMPHEHFAIGGVPASRDVKS
jgi:4-oxalocrotonate tautomerase